MNTAQEDVGKCTVAWAMQYARLASQGFSQRGAEKPRKAKTMNPTNPTTPEKAAIAVSADVIAFYERSKEAREVNLRIAGSIESFKRETGMLLAKADALPLAVLDDTTRNYLRGAKNKLRQLCTLLEVVENRKRAEARDTARLLGLE